MYKFLFKDFFRLDSKKYDMISVNVEIRKKLRKEMEKSYESKRSEFEKEKDKNSDGADGFRYTVGSQTVFPGKLPQYVSGNLNIDPFYGSTVSGQETERHNTTGTGNSDSDLYLFSRNSWRN